MDVIEQVGESYDEINVHSLHMFEGHMLNIVGKMGYEYEPKKRMGIRELSMDSFLRCMTGDVFKRQPIILDRLGKPSTKFKKQFISWIKGVFNSVENTRYQRRISGGLTGNGPRSYDKPTAADINGIHLNYPNAYNSFLKV